MVNTLDLLIYIEDSNYKYNLNKFQFHIEYFTEVKPNKTGRFENFKNLFV